MTSRFRGPFFTYFGSDHSIAKTRIDRFLVSDGAGGWFSNTCQRSILWVVSNHIPMTAFSGGIRSTRRPFRFFNVWYQDPELGSLIENSWESLISHVSLWISWP